MSDRPGRTARIMDALEEKAPWLHRFLTDDEPPIRPARNLAGTLLAIAIAIALLWGGTGQSLGDAPVVVIESGSMMHCGDGSTSGSRGCTSTSFGRLVTIDPGDLVFVRDIDGRGDVHAFAEGGKERFGKAGDVIIYDRGNGQPPIIHRAMFWIDIHGDGTFSVPELGITRSSNLDHPAIRDADRFGLSGNCQLFNSHTRNTILDSHRSGWITKGDNVLTNPCWDQGTGSIYPVPVEPDQVLGKARGQIPWIGLLKLWVFDIFQGTSNYANAPRDLRNWMWTSVVLLVGVPYGIEYVLKRRAASQEAEELHPGEEKRD